MKLGKKKPLIYKKKKRNHIGHFGAVGFRLSYEKSQTVKPPAPEKSIIKVMLLIIGWLLRSDQSDLCVYLKGGGGGGGEEKKRRGSLKSRR